LPESICSGRKNWSRSSAYFELRSAISSSVSFISRRVCDLERGQNSHAQRIDGHRCAGDLVHAAVDVRGKLVNIFRVMVATQVISLVVNHDLV
jgi:hypothetical protein